MKYIFTILILVISTSAEIYPEKKNYLFHNKLLKFSKKIFNALKTKNFNEYLKYHAIVSANYNEIIKNLNFYFNLKYDWEKILQITTELNYKIAKHRNNIIKKVKTRFRKTRNSLPGYWSNVKILTAGIYNLYTEDALIKADVKVFFTLGTKYFYIILKGVITTKNENFYTCDGISKVNFLFNKK